MDAASALITKLYINSYEAQGPMQLEALSKSTGKAIPLRFTKDVDGIWRVDWQPLITYIQDENITIQERAETFHISMAHVILEQALQLREEHQVTKVGLTGGVFQNRILTEQAVELLEEHDFIVYLSEHVPCNDAGISYGQIIEYGSMLK